MNKLTFLIFIFSQIFPSSSGHILLSVRQLDFAEETWTFQELEPLFEFLLSNYQKKSSILVDLTFESNAEYEITRGWDFSFENGSLNFLSSSDEETYRLIFKNNESSLRIKGDFHIENSYLTKNFDSITFPTNTNQTSVTLLFHGPGLVHFRVYKKL